MKYFALSCACLVAVASLAPSKNRDDGLIGHWPLAEDCRDQSGHARHGENHGVEFDAAGSDTRSARFNGRDAFIAVPADRAPRLGSGDFAIAVWVRADERGDDVPGDLLSQFDPDRRRGFSLRISQNAVTTAQANHRNVHFGIDNGRLERTWTDHGRPGNAVKVFALTVFDGSLFATTCEPARDAAGHVFRFGGAERWIDCGSPDRSNAITSLAVYRGQLYAGSSKYRLGGSALPESENEHRGGRVFRYSDGEKWEPCGELPETEAIGGLVVFRDRLYASSLYRPAGFFRYESGTNWTPLETPGGKRVEAMCVFNGQLFASSYDEAHVFRFDGTTWADCGQVGGADNTQTYSFAVHEGKLFVGTWRSGRVFRYDGDDRWSDVGQLGDELEVMGMMVHNGKLFAGTLPSAGVFRFDGAGRWTDVGRVDQTPDVKYRRAWSMAEFQGRLFCGTLPSGHVLSIEAGKNVTHDRELAPGWRHLTAVRDTGRLKLFIDGKLVARSVEFERADYDLTNDQPLKIGFGPNDFFNGRLRDLQIYSRPLADGEISKLATRPETPR